MDLRIDEKTTIPLIWVLTASAPLAGLALWLVTIFNTGNANAVSITELGHRVRFNERHIHYIEDDLSFLRGKEDPNFHQVREQRRREDAEHQFDE